MTDMLMMKQVALEKEARGLAISDFHGKHEDGASSGTYSETFVGSNLMKNYINPIVTAIDEWRGQASKGRPGPKNAAARKLVDIPTGTLAYLTVKGVIDKIGTYQGNKPTPFTAQCLHIAGLIHTELRLQEFEKQYSKKLTLLLKDFNQRELPRYKREEYMQSVFKSVGLDWSIWSTTDRLHIGSALLGVFQRTTGDIRVQNVGRGSSSRDIIIPSESMMETLDKQTDNCADVFSLFFPMVIPPTPWSADNLEMGGYKTPNVNHYGLVKKARAPFKERLKALADEGKLTSVFAAVNAIQETAWRVNVPVLDIMEEVYARNIRCGKLPSASALKLPEPPHEIQGMTKEEILTHTDETSPVRIAWMEYMAQRFGIHEENRRVISRRVMAMSAFRLARKFSEYDAIYFPHDLDSQGRAYPKPSRLSPQGPDFIKGLLKFSEGKRLGKRGVYWLGVHGANCFGNDKADIDDRYQWSVDNLWQIKEIASDPLNNLAWTEADAPAQYLAWCLAWAEAHSLDDPEDYVCSLHVDLDATCSGLQHFSAMLRDEVGGHHVNMTPSATRNDVYQAVADTAIQLIMDDRKGDEGALAEAWLKFGLDRGTTKRPVMVKPYSGTLNSCNAYVADAVRERIKEGEPVPWDKKRIWEFSRYGGLKIWAAIPQIVVAADQAMKWLSAVSRAVGKSQPDEKCIQWVTPSGFPVWRYRFDTTPRRVRTFFDGQIVRPRLAEDTDQMDARKLGTSIPPGFVHSLDGSHLQLTVSAARRAGLTAFAVVHDSFGVHAADVEQFSQIIREEFVSMYEDNDVLVQFYEGVEHMIDQKYKDKLPTIPLQGQLDLKGVLQNPFFFS